MTDHIHDIALIGAGPIGIETAAALKRNGFDYVHLEKGAIGQTMFWWPPETQWFSSNERISIAGFPVQTPGQTKATREQYLAYLRTVVRGLDLTIHTHEPVAEVTYNGEGFELVTRRMGVERRYVARKVILAVGDTDKPRMLDVPGEDLPHVTHVLEDPHKYVQRKVVIIGGKNSAAEAALRCWHAGADVTICHRGPSFDRRAIKYWLLPEMMGRIERGEMGCHHGVEVQRITPTHVELQRQQTGEAITVPGDFVIAATGFVADSSLFHKVGVELEGERAIPRYDLMTMQTNVPGVYVAGTAVAGTQQSYEVFLENCHVHVDRILAHLLGHAPPPDPVAYLQQEA